MKRLELTQHTVRCPRTDRTASLTVRTDPGAYPSRRHRDVTACSLMPSTSFVPPARKVHLPDPMPPLPYVYDIHPAPCHSPEVACPRPCLAVLNAAETGAAEPVRCVSGISDSLELAHRTQSPAIRRLLWFFGV
jgi:hypothetical protein